MMETHESGDGPFDRLFRAFDRERPDAGYAGIESGDWLGPYRVDGLIGQGGMGAVLLAHRADGQFRQTVAIKVLRRDVLGDEPRRHFLAERQILAQLDHPNIARVFDGGVTEDGRPFLVMEYVEGQPIDRFCDDRRLPVGKRLRLFVDVCDAVQYAHQNLVVHRDLKPGNVLVSNDGRPKLLDFGVAKLLRRSAEERETRAGWTPMTPAYASPEQVRGDPVTTAADVYALGVLLYELLTGTVPHQLTGLTPFQIIRTLEETNPSPPSAAVASDGAERAKLRGTSPQALERRIAGDLDVIVTKALQRDPRRRYPSAAELSADISRHLEGHPVSARPDTVGYRLSRTVRRHPAATGLALTIVLSLAGFGATMAIQSARVSRARDQAERVTALITDVLASADPTIVPGEELTVREALDRAVERLEARPEEPDPVVDARLLNVIASAYDNLDAHDRAVELLSDALARLRAEVAPDHPALLATLTRLGGALNHMGQRDEAVEVSEEAVRIARTLGRDRADELAAALNTYGLALHSRGESEAAEPYYLEALSLHENMESPPDSAVEVVLANLGWAAHARADWIAAEEWFRDLLGRRIEHLGGNHPRTAITRLSLADVLNRRGEVEQAHVMADSALTAIRAAYPAGHSQLANALRVNASLLIGLERLEEGATMLAEAIEIYRGNEDAYGSGIRYATNTLARVRERQGRLDEAIALYTESADGFAQAVGEGHPFTAVVRTNVAWAEYRRGRSREAERIFRAALPVLDSAWVGTPSISLTLVNYGEVLASAGKCDEAEPLLGRAVGLELEQLPEDHDRVIRARRLWGGCLLELTRFEEAESPLLAAYHSLLEARGPDDAFTVAAASDLQRLYVAWGRQDEAERYRPGS